MQLTNLLTKNIMFQKIVSISGKPGLFRLISQSKNMVVVESLIDGKRQPAFQNEKISTLNDIAMFTDTGEKPLREIFKTTLELENGRQIAIDAKNAPNEALREYFEKVLPNFDKEKIYPNDIKKFILWYNLLVEKNITTFDEMQEEESADTPKVEKPKVLDNKQNTSVKSSKKAAKANTTGSRQTTRVASKKGS